MSDFLLTEFADEAALQKQTALILSSFDEIEKRALTVSGSVKDAMSSLSNKGIGSKATLDEIQKLDDKTKDYSASAKVLSTELKTNAEAITKVTAALNDSNKSLADNVTYRTKLQNTIQSYLIDQKEDLSLLKQGVISREEYNKRLTDSTVKIEQNKNKVAELNKIIGTQAQTENQKAAAISAAAAKETKVQADLANTYKQLSTQYNEAALKAKILATQLGVGNPVAIEAAANAKKLGNQLKEIDASVGQNQRNVGNYAGSLGGFFTQLYSKVRVLANILPGIGISGVFLAIFEGAKYATEQLGLFTGKLTETARQTQLLADINEEYSKSAGKEIGTLEALYSVATNTNVAITDRKAAVNELQKQYPDYFKNISAEIILQGRAKDAYDAAKEAILQKAKAQAIEAKLSEIETKDLDIRYKQQLDKAKLTAAEMKRIDADSNNKNVDKETRGLDQFNAISEMGRVNKDIEDSNKELADLDKDRKFLLDQVAKVPEGLVTKPLKTGKGTGDKQLQALKDKQNAEFDLYKIAQEAKLRADENDLKSDRVYYLDKLTILDDFVQKSKELLGRQEQNDIAVKEREAAREIQRLNEEKTGKNGSQIARINENIKIVQANLAEDIKKIRAKSEDDGIKLVQNAAIARQKLVDDELKAEEALYAEYAKADQDNLDKTNERFKEALKKRLKQEEEYNKKSAELAKELTQQKIELGLKGEGFLYSIATATFQNQLNQNKQAQNEVDKRQQQELAANDALVQSAEDKAANITIINARAQAQKDALDKKNRDIETQKAKFERAQQIFEIGISTIKSLALIKANAAALSVNPLYGPVFGKLLAAQALTQIPLLLATSALSIGALLAQPLPQYFKGRSKNDPYTGYATVNEIRREAIERKDGSIEFPQGKNVLTYLEKGDAVHPYGEEFMSNLRGSALRDAGRVAGKKGGVDIHFSTARLESKLDQQNKLLKVIADKPVDTTIGTDTGMVRLMQWGSKQVQYKDQNTNW